MRLLRFAFILSMLSAAVFRLPAQSFGDYEIDWKQVDALVQEHFEVPAVLPPPSQLSASLRLIEKAMEQGSVSDLARLSPYAHQAYNVLRVHPRFTPYLDWLVQRLDYFDVAVEVQSPLPPAKPTPVKGTRPSSTTTPKPVRITRVSDAVLWEKKMKSRKSPGGAAALTPLVKPVFAREGIPTEWVWIAEVESSFNPLARSPVGAAGLFQLMPATARQLGLNLEPEDERLQPEKNARAAAKYLRYLHGRFEDWPLVLAAYNAGEGRVSKLTRQYGRTFEAIADYLPTETRMYVPKVLATVSVREGVNAQKLPAPGPVPGR